MTASASPTASSRVKPWPVSSASSMAPNKSTYPERTKKILRVTLLGSASNALLVLLKLFVGIVGHSSAMIAEAINSISDFLTDIIALIFIRISGKPQDKDHHYGHGKFGDATPRSSWQSS